MANRVGSSSSSYSIPNTESESVSPPVQGGGSIIPEAMRELIRLIVARECLNREKVPLTSNELCTIRNGYLAMVQDGNERGLRRLNALFPRIVDAIASQYSTATSL